MKRKIVLLAAIVLCTLSSAYALYELSLNGEWPNTWPKELEPLRKKSRTLVGPEVANQHFAIPFANRAEFEAAWPHLLKVKSKAGAVVLTRGQNFFLEEGAKAGVIVHAPAEGQEKNPATPDAPINVSNWQERYMYTTFLEVVVDGEIIDLNRIPLPADTPIVDDRFKDDKGKKGK